MTDRRPRPTTPSTRLARSAGTPAGPPPSRRSRPMGDGPARVVAVHRRRRSSATATATGRPACPGAFRFEALGHVGLPDGRRLGRARCATASSRRSCRGGPSSSGWPPTSSRRQAGLDDEQVMASNVDVALLVAGLDNDFNLRRIERYLAVAWSSGVTPVVVLNKADLADDVDGRLVAVEADRAGRRDRRGLGLDRRRARRPARRTCARARPPRSSARRASASPRSSTPCSARTARRPPRSASRTRAGRHTTTHRELFELPGGALLVDTPGHPRARGPRAPRTGVEAAFDDVAEIAAACRFSDCRHEGEPGCAVRARARGRPPRPRSGSRATASSSASWHGRRARTTRAPEPRTGAPGRSSTSPSSEHMERKYGDEPMTTDHRDHRAGSRSRRRHRSPGCASGCGATTATGSRWLRSCGRQPRDGVPWVPTAEQLRVEHRRESRARPGQGHRPRRGRWAVVAVGEVERVVRDGEPMYEVSGHVHPEFRRRGIGNALHAWTVRRAHERAARLEPGRRGHDRGACRRGRGR